MNASKDYYEKNLFVWKNLFEKNTSYNLPKSIELLEKTLTVEQAQVIVIALGPLSNIVELIKKNPGLSTKIETVLWYCDFNEQPKGYNYENSKDAIDVLMKAHVPLKFVSSANNSYNSNFFTICSKMNSIYAKTLFNAFANTNLDTINYKDELLPLYLLYPGMFNEVRTKSFAQVIRPKDETIFDILITGILNYDKPEQGMIFNEIPTSGYMLKKGFANIADTILKTHGYSEFKSISMCSEIQADVNIYAILGAKVGIRIKDYFHVGLDETVLISYAGHKPYMSFFNDGLQFGSGVTIGHGNFKIKDADNASLSVIVTYNGRKVRFSLKHEIIDELNKDLSILGHNHNEEVHTHQHTHSNGHTHSHTHSHTHIDMHNDHDHLDEDKIKELAIKKYWLGLSRYDIVDIIEE